jgi:menaquinone-dependent protoporphyrinogen oxidase
MSEKVLVAYGSKYGATAEIAEAIGEVLRESGLDVEVLSADSVGDLAGYWAVVLGSGVYAGRWRKEAARFLQDRAAELAQRPVWIFASGPTGEGDAVELMEGWVLPPPLRAVADRIAPRDITAFHGNIDVSKLGFIEKRMIKMVKAPTGDFRDWDAIRAWAASIAAELAG